MRIHDDYGQHASENPQDRGAWGAQSAERLTSAQVMISRIMSSSPATGSVLTAWSLEPALDSASPTLSLCPSPAHALSLSLSQKEINVKKSKKKQRKSTG